MSRNEFRLVNTTRISEEAIRKASAEEFDIEFMDFFEEKKKPEVKQPVRPARPPKPAGSQTAQRQTKPAGSQQAQRPTRPAGTQPVKRATRPAGAQQTQRPARPTSTQRPTRPAGTQQTKRPVTQETPAKRPARPADAQQTQRPVRPAGTKPVQGTTAQRPVQQRPVSTQKPAGATRPAGAQRTTAARPVSSRQTTRPAPKLQHPSQGAKQAQRPVREQQVRPTDKPQATAKAEKKPKAKSKFRKAFLISWIAFTVILIAALVLLTVFLSNFEKSRPAGTISRIIRDVQGGDLSGLHLKTADGETLDSGTILYDVAELAQHITEKAGTADSITYRIINGESDETKKTYLVKAGDEKALKVTVERSDKKYLFGFTGWEETETTLLADAFRVTTLRAQIPHDCQLSVNGTLIGRERVTSEGARISLLSRLISEGYIDEQPGMDTYEIPGIYFRKDVKLIDASGATQECVHTNDLYTGGFDASQEFIDSQYDRVINMFEPYALYFSGERGRGALNEVMVYDSPAYNSAVSADVSWMQEHSDVEITEKKAEHFKKYSDQVFSCDISFLQTIYQGEEAVRTWDTNMTWIFIWDGDDYYVADFVTRAADEG
ncbi:MAG: hypothetical protein IKZ95_04675 [Lachnospiraceae bacterium]|nr:hypothetical protein [Lachnospiraceae bacterium]